MFRPIMLSRRSRFRFAGVAFAFVGPLVACATSTGPSMYSGSPSGSNSSLGIGGSSQQTVAFGGDSGLGTTTTTGGDGSTRLQRCDDAGNCHCFNLASVGYGGATGAQAGKGGTDNTSAFVAYLNDQSSNNSVGATLIGCGTDTGCTSPNKPDFSDPAFLAQYDVLIFQWMTNSIHPVTMNGQSYGFTGDPGLGGGGYWTFSQAELDAIKAWVNKGGGVIVLSGYDYCPGNPGCTSPDGELGPTNQLVQALTDMSYTATDTFGTTMTGNAAFCLGDSDPVTGWAQTSLLGAHITEVGAFHGRGIQTGPKATIDCQTGGAGVCAAHEDVGQGHVYVYTDEWVTYTSQWNPTPQPAGYCVTDGSISGGDFPAAQSAYQVPQFWYNAITYAAQATMCPFSLTGTIPR